MSPKPTDDRPAVGSRFQQSKNTHGFDLRATIYRQPTCATTLYETMATSSSSASSATQQQRIPLFDSFLDVPHPAASPGSPPVRVIASSPDAPLPPPGLVQQVQQFAYPEYEGVPRRDALTPPPATRYPRPVNRYDQYAMQPKSFTSFTCTLQRADGTRLYGHVRRSLPAHEAAPGRYDVGRRGERAWILLTRMAGAELLFSAILK